MNWNHLAEYINKMPLDKRLTDATVVCLDSGEIIPLIDLVPEWPDEAAKEESPDIFDPMGFEIVEGVLDYDHPFMTIAF